MHILSKLRQDGIISEYVESGKRDFALEFSSSLNYSKYIKGATYVSLENSMIIQEEISNSLIEATLDHRPDSQPLCFRFRKYLPMCLYPCQNTTIYGIIFPKFKSSIVDTRHVWIVATLVSRIELLWRIIF